MKLFYSALIFLLTACASDSDWSSGGSAQNAYGERQAQEQVESTRQQLPTAGKAQVNQSQPF